jgi:hypothetical protein
MGHDTKSERRNTQEIRMDRQLLLARKFAQLFLFVAIDEERGELAGWATAPKSVLLSPIVKSMVNCFVGNSFLLHILFTVHNGHFREACEYLLLDKRYRIPGLSPDCGSDWEGGKLQEVPIRHSVGALHFSYELPECGRANREERIPQMA